MKEKGTYKTKHQAELTAYLETIPGRHFTVADICDYFRSKGKPMGTTTVYRQIEHMVQDGTVIKYVLDGTSAACFAYQADSAHCDEECFHCKCEQCGRLIHLHCDELSGIREHLWKHHGFELNPLKTVFYGVCEECAG